MYTVQVNLCQKDSFIHQLTHNIMTTDCSLNFTSLVQENYYFSKSFVHQIVFCSFTLE